MEIEEKITKEPVYEKVLKGYEEKVGKDNDRS